jgi:hypothetical protein
MGRFLKTDGTRHYASVRQYKIANGQIETTALWDSDLCEPSLEDTGGEENIIEALMVCIDAAFSDGKDD